MISHIEHNLKSIAGLGYQLVEQKRFKEAMTIFEGLNTLFPNHIYFELALGSLYAQQQDYGAALLHYGHALDIDPEDALARFQRAEVYLRMKRIHLALEDLRKLTQSNCIDSQLLKRAKMLLKVHENSELGNQF